MNEQIDKTQIKNLVIAALLKDKKSLQIIQQIMQAALQGDESAILLANLILLTVQELQQEAQSNQIAAAKFGTKLNYIRRLRGQCPMGYKMQYLKQGGNLCKTCVPDELTREQIKTNKNSVDAFKCGRKMKKVKKASDGDRVTLKKETLTQDPYDDIWTAIRYWNDGTKSQMQSDEGGTLYIGRNGEVGITNVPNFRLNQVADSLRRVDWQGNSVPKLKVPKPGSNKNIKNK